MAGSVLGKRARGSAAASAAADTGVVTRAKRRVQQLVIGNDENQNPFVTRENRVESTHVADSEIEELVIPSKRQRKSRNLDSVPAKHGAPESRVALSPAKINDNFKNSKPSVSTCFDGEDKQAWVPQTPRRRDALSKQLPTTPRHRVGVVGKPLTPRTPRTPSTPKSLFPTVYNEARQVFARSVHPGQLVGRENERQELADFLTERVSTNRSGCIYISGPPGTGKSALVNDVGSTVGKTELVKMSYVNCMSIKNAKDLYGKLLEDLVDDVEALECSELDSLKALFFGTGTTYLVTLDEIDHMLDVDLELLYTLFEWSLEESSSLVLVGIANALDFTNRFLPRLKARNLRVQLLPFMPYTASQIAAVITSKLQSLLSPQDRSEGNYVPFVHPTAIQFLAKKVAAQTGDLRKAFDICRSTIDLIESETRTEHMRKATVLTPQKTPTKLPLVENINLSSPPTTRSPTKPANQIALAASLADLTAATAPRATIAHVARVTARVFGNGTTQRLQTLNLQQKAALCALCALEKKNRTSASAAIMAAPVTPSKRTAVAPTVRALFEAYTRLCKKDQVLHPLTATEFRDVIGSLEALSLITAVEARGGVLPASVTPSKRGRKAFGASAAEERRMASVVGEAELLSALEGAGSMILREILESDGLASLYTGC